MGVLIVFALLGIVQRSLSTLLRWLRFWGSEFFWSIHIWLRSRKESWVHSNRLKRTECKNALYVPSGLRSVTCIAYQHNRWTQTPSVWPTSEQFGPLHLCIVKTKWFCSTSYCRGSYCSQLNKYWYLEFSACTQLYKNTISFVKKK